MKMNYDGIPDDELIVRLKNGESGIEDYLLDKYKTLVRKNARVLYLEGGDREDLLQEGMLGLFKAIHAYDPDREASFYTYASQCITHQMYSAVSSARRKKHTILNESISLSDIEEKENTAEAFYVNDPENIILEQEAETQLLEKIKKSLSPMENKVLSMFLEGMSYKEISQKLCKSDKSVDNALQRIKTKIRALKNE